MEAVGVKRIGAIILVAVGLLTLGISLPQLFETNNEGYYQIRQAALTGEVSVRSTPGTYLQNFSTITTYPISDVYDFSSDKSEGEEHGEPINVAFNGGGRAAISGSVKFRLSLHEDDQKLLHQDFRSYQAVERGLIRSVVQEVFNKTAATMKAEESYSSKLAEFTQLAEDQLVNGVYETKSRVDKTKDSDGNDIVDTIIEIERDKDGRPLVAKKSPLLRYKVEIINFVIKRFEYDEKTTSIIAKKQEAEQAKVVARANAERAKQDAITAAEQGKAEVAKAEAEALVAKKTAVIEAQKQYEVAEQLKKKAKEESDALLVTARAEAESNRLKVAAGLTPQERAEFDMKTKIGVAAEMAKMNFPSTMIIGGGGGSPTNPFDAIGLEAYMRINKKMSGE
jgi:regulator of protease activity HflC (stomatin/prohibitin superfamily)